MTAIKQFVCLDDYETRAKELLSLPIWLYYSSGADCEETLRENRNSYRRYWLKPRVLRHVSARDMSTTILGEKIDMPICVSPTAFHGMAHPDGEIATCKAAADMNTMMVLSLMSNKSLEDIAAARPTSLKWMNVAIWHDRGATNDVLRRAEKAAFKAVVVSVDTAVHGVKRELASLGGYAILPSSHLGNLVKYTSKDIRFAHDIPRELAAPHMTWKDVEWLTRATKLPIVLKGIVTVDDALLAAEHDVQGILVSNHGGRHLDGVPATIDVLPDIVAAVGDKIEVYMDGGIRTGTDVLKALALGARAVFIGKPVVYGLACNGEDGVKEVLRILRDEFSRAMALTGC